MPELTPPALPGSLDARFPVLLLPVNVQVKFVQTSATAQELRVRIYPDQLGIGTHEPGLTAEEVTAGQQYWTQAPGHDLAHWRPLVGRFGVPRAQWILRQTIPTNLPAVRSQQAAPQFPAPAVAEARWQRAAEARGLPDRFSVLLYTQADTLDQVTGGPVKHQLFEAPQRAYDPQTVLQPTTEFLRLAKVVQGEPLGPKALAVGLAPPTSLDTPPAAIGGVDAGNEWTVDFAQAQAQGMAVAIPLTPDEYARGFQRLVVLGVRAAGPAAGQQAVEELLTEHYYTDGLQLVPQGTPTNNTDAVAAGYSSRERADADASFALLTQDATFPAGAAWAGRPDGQHLNAALGLADAALPPLANAQGRDAAAALAMNRALWPATYGYFLEEMLRPLLSADDLAWTRDFFENYVLARGAVPALRVGTQPYGVLPTTRFSAWEAGADPRAEKLRHVLAQLDATWTERLNPQPGLYPAAVGAGATTAGFAEPTAAQNLLTTLGLDATSTEYYQRYLIGPVLADALNGYAQGLHGDDPTAAESIWPGAQHAYAHFDPAQNPLYQEFQQLLDPSGALGLPAAAPPIFGQTFQSTFTKLADAFADEPAARRGEGVLLDDQPLSETAPLAAFRGVHDEYRGWNYVQWLATASFEEIRLEDFRRLVADNAAFVAPNSLLYRLLRQAVLLAYWAAAQAYFDAPANNRVLPAAARPEKELFNITATNDQARWAWLYDAGPGQAPLHERLRTAGSALDVYLTGLAPLAGLPTAQLERLLAEHLDLGSYRLDAWRLAPVLQRLAAGRQSPATAQGSHLGAFGWLENVVPGDSSVPGPTGLDDPDNLGYVHAPSLVHGTAAAILRQGYKSRQFTADAADPAAARMAVDLSSRRVRAALALLNGLRAGLSLGTLLGQAFERALRQPDMPQPDNAAGARFGTYVPVFRTAFPLADEHLLAGGQPVPQGTAPELAARQVVDGAALLRAGGQYPYDVAQLLSQDPAFADFLAAQVAILADNLDALGDLAVSEGIYQAARGNTDRAAAVLDGVAKGLFPPDPDVVHPPQRGFHLTQRVLVQLPADTTLGQWPAMDTPRARAAPRLNAWLAQFLPDPGALDFSYGYRGDDGQWQAQQAATLHESGLHPIDLLYLLDDQALQAGSAFDRLLLYAFAPSAPAGGALPPAAPLAIDYDGSTGARALRQRLPLLARLRQLLGTARPAKPHDLQAPGRLAEPDGDVGANTADLINRLEISQQQLNDVAASLVATAAPLRASLYQAALFGIAEATAGLAADAAPAATKAAVLQAVQLRLTAAPGAVATVDDAVALAAALFGPAFRPDVEFTLGGAAAAYAAATAAATGLLRAYAGQPLALQEWLHGMGSVREPMNQLDKVLLIQDLLAPTGPPLLPLHPAQLSAAGPAPGGDYWLGLPWPADYQPPGDALSLVQWLPDNYDPAYPQCALWLDEWTETLPLATQTTALTFHFDQPNTAAPQSLLLVVSPRADATAPWTTDDLLGAVNETLDLAKKRTVEPDMLAFTHLATVLPAVVAPVAQQAVTFTLDLGRLNGTARFNETPLLAP
ncbi:MAG: hypothetical protein ACRYG7_46275 [Janthinobacterium lividum]